MGSTTLRWTFDFSKKGKNYYMKDEWAKYILKRNIKEGSILVLRWDIIKCRANLHVALPHEQTQNMLQGLMADRNGGLLGVSPTTIPALVPGPSAAAAADSFGASEKENKVVQISNLNPLLTGEHLKQLFQFCGTVVACTITDSKEFHIEYVKPEEANSALALNNVDICGRPMIVEMARSLTQEPEATAAEMERSVTHEPEATAAEMEKSLAEEPEATAAEMERSLTQEPEVTAAEMEKSLPEEPEATAAEMEKSHPQEPVDSSALLAIMMQLAEAMQKMQSQQTRLMQQTM